MNIKKIFKKTPTSKKYIDNLQKHNIKIGNCCRVFDPANTIIDTQNPHMLEIGDNVYITSGVKILTHDYSWVVLSGKYGDINDGVGHVKIGNNVFIGMNTIILKNTTVGNNVIIGAGSVASGNIESNSVYAGVPAKKIMSIEDFYAKKRNASLESAQKIYNNYYKKFNKEPPRKLFHEYISLYITKVDDLTKDEIGLIKRTGHYEKIYYQIANSSHQFNNYDEFIKHLSKEFLKKSCIKHKD